MIQIFKKMLYIFSDNVYLHIDGETIIIKQDEKELRKLPLLSIEGIVLFGNATISSYLIKKCSEHNIILSYVSKYGNFIGRFYGKNNGNVFLRKQQYSMYDNDKSLDFVKNIISFKTINQSNLLRYYSRIEKDDQKSERLFVASESIRSIAKNIFTVNSIDAIRGLEGSVATIYFNRFDDMIKVNDNDMLLGTRSKNPPLNNANALLSLFYTFYTTNVTSALETFGLDSQCGYMHRMRSGRPSLSCDMIEEFRAPIIDKFVIKLINLKRVSSDDFEKSEEGIKLKDDSLKRVSQLWENYKEEEIFFPLYNKKVKIKILPYLQSQLLTKYIRGDIDEYPPFFYKLM